MNNFSSNPNQSKYFDLENTDILLSTLFNQNETLGRDPMQKDEKRLSWIVAKSLGIPIMLIIITLVIVTTSINIIQRKRKLSKYMRKMMKMKTSASIRVYPRDYAVSVITPRHSTFSISTQHSFCPQNI